jgi:UDP-GlcNAc:undecaprenyl-phosphate/decaprenyl-phosphate GlcNAc-1-phosphate transferase
VSNPLDQYVLLFLGSVITLITARISIFICSKFKIIDFPGRTPHAIHKDPRPLGGGIAISFSLAILLLVFLSEFSSEIYKIIIPSIIIFGFGLLDDIKGLDAPSKLFGQLVAVIFIIASGIRIQIFENTDFFITVIGAWAYWIDILITIIWVIGVTNAFNLTDSMDGVALGLAVIASAFFMLACIYSNQPNLATYSAMLLGICLGLSIYNFYPAQLFLGDSGAQLLGFQLSIIGMWYTPMVNINQNSSWFVPILVLGFPIFDTCLVFFSRVRKAVPFYKAQLDHTYHRLVSLGFPVTRAIYTIHFSAILLGWFGISLMYFPPLIANLAFFACVLTGFGLIAFFDHQR